MSAKHEPRCRFAKEIFKHYFRQCATRVGVKWDPDSDLEIERAVDEIYAEAVIAAKREILDRVRRLYADRKSHGLHGDH